MDGIDTIFSREDMTFQEAVDYFKERVPVTAEIFYQIAEEYRALAFTVSGYTRPKSSRSFTTSCSPRWRRAAPSRSSRPI